MEIISTYSNGNYEAQIGKTFEHNYIINYMINGKVIKKTTHLSLETAESIAEDFILDGGSDPQFLSE
jgi:hypothetical protein